MLKALKVESEADLLKSQQAGTKLNICAILSQLNKHNEAIKYCKAATNDLMTTLKIIRLKNMKNKEKRRLLMEVENVTEEQIEAVDQEDRPQLHQTLGIAYYNLSIEYEYVQEYECALENLNKSRFFSSLRFQSRET